MNHVEKYNWDTGQMDPVPANAKVIEKFVNFFLNSKAWVDDIDLVNLKVLRLRRDLANTPAEEPTVMLAAPPVSRIRQKQAS